jgi:hypothetical protein
MELVTLHGRNTFLQLHITHHVPCILTDLPVLDVAVAFLTLNNEADVVCSSSCKYVSSLYLCIHVVNTFYILLLPSNIRIHYDG